MASDSGPSFHYVQNVEAAGTVTSRTSESPCSCLTTRPISLMKCGHCNVAVTRENRHETAYCAVCMAIHHKGCFVDRPEKCRVPGEAGMTPQAPAAMSGGTMIQQALLALRETRDHAAQNIQQTRMAFDATKAASESGSMNTKRFGKTA